MTQRLYPYLPLRNVLETNFVNTQLVEYHAIKAGLTLSDEMVWFYDNYIA
jgi:hypothetical protein